MKVTEPESRATKRSSRRVKVVTTCTGYFSLDAFPGFEGETTQDLVEFIQDQIGADKDCSDLAMFAWENELVDSTSGFELDVEIIE